MEKLTPADIAQVEAERQKLKQFYEQKYAPTRVKRTLTDHVCSRCNRIIPKHSKNAWYIRGRLGASANHNPVFSEAKYVCGFCHSKGE